MAIRSSNKGYPPGSFTERLVQVIDLLGSRRALALAAGIPESTLQMCLQRRSEPTRPLLLAIARASNVSVHWLVTGEGAAKAEVILDEALLRDVIAAVEQGIRETSVSPYADPTRKAQLIAELYKQFCQEDPSSAKKTPGARPPRLLRLVQSRLVA